MMCTLEDAPLRARLALAQQQLTAGDTLSEVQGVLLYGVDSAQAAIRVTLALLVTALPTAASATHRDMAAGKLLEAIAIAAAHPDAGPTAPYLARLAPDLAAEAKRALGQQRAAWSASDLVWVLMSAVAIGWADIEVEIDDPLGEWDVGPANAAFQALLAAATLEAWARF